MPPRFYSGELNAATYDLGIGRAVIVAEGDVELYSDLARQAGGRVLELASGTGRVSIPLAEAGHEVTGLELSPAMLREAETKRAERPQAVRGRLAFIRGDMRDFALDREFDLVVIAYRSFGLLISPEAQLECLASVRTHLRPGGLLAIDIFDPDLRLLVDDARARSDRGVDPRTGHTVRVEVVASSRDHLRQVLRETWSFTELDPHGRVLRSEDEELVLRWTYRTEMRHLLTLAGFEVVAEWSDYRRSPPRYAAEQVWLARRPDG